MRNWLSFVANQASLYKKAQTAASKIRETLSKKNLSNEDKSTLKTNLLTLGTIKTADELPTTIQNPGGILGITYPEIPKHFAFPGNTWIQLLTPNAENGQQTYDTLDLL